MFALKQLGAHQVLSVSAVGSLKEYMPPGDFVIVDQFIDRTRGRASTFFDDFGIVAHVSFGDPVDAALSAALRQAAEAAGVRVHTGGTYVCMEGPQFSSRAESELYRSWGASVIGMTNLPEAKLAREAELPYASLAMVTDYDCWRQSEEEVSVETVIAVLNQNVARAREVIVQLVSRLPDPAKSPASSALQNTILTSLDAIGYEARQKLAPLLCKYVR
jgi:5'-methylthioadenosine phosphorylase